MKYKIQKVTTTDGEEVTIPLLYEKNDEFYIFSKLCLKKLATLTSAKAMILFFTILSYNRYNDDRIKLLPSDKKEIMKKLKIDRQHMWRLTKILIDAGLIMEDGDIRRIPANLAFYGERKTKQMLMRSYATRQLQVNQDFETSK